MASTTTGASASVAARKILQELCSIPTAPFAEQRVARYAEAFVRKRRRLGLTSDAFGNLLIELPSKRKKTSSNQKAPRRVFTAHMDHPGFVAEKMGEGRVLHAYFYGGVMPEYFPGSRVKFFDGDDEISAKVIGFWPADKDHPNRATLRVSRPVAPGTLGMWDVGAGRFSGKRFLSRVCDDLAGAAAALAMLDALVKKPPEVDVAVLLTRGEEEGFIGAIAASLKPKLLRKTDHVIAIECSSVQPQAPQGDGAIIRVGDRTSIFNSSLTYFMTQVAVNLGHNDKKFKFQRTLMPGGTCEATVYDIYGFTAASICVALGNYHNMDKARKKIAPEYIDVGDWDSMVKLFIELARRGHEYEPGNRALKDKVEAKFNKMKHLLNS